MQMAIDVAGFTAAESDQLRQAMGSKRSQRRMELLHARFLAVRPSGASTDEVAEELWEKLAAFANYGFPESHSVSFAYLVYASSWLKRYEPAAFCVGLLNAQPMGFYSPHSLVRDARRHGVPVRGPDVNASRCRGHRSRSTASTWPGPGPTRGRRRSRGGSAVRRCASDRLGARASATTWPRPSPPVGPTPTPRTWPAAPARPSPQLEALATAGALDCFGPSRRAGAVDRRGGGPVPSRPPGRHRHRSRGAARCRA